MAARVRCWTIGRHDRSMSHVARPARSSLSRSRRSDPPASTGEGRDITVQLMDKCQPQGLTKQGPGGMTAHPFWHRSQAGFGIGEANPPGFQRLELGDRLTVGQRTLTPPV
jgi:hypothetical protein